MPLGGRLGPAPYLEAQQDAEVPGGHVLDLVEHVELLPGRGGDGIHLGALAWGDTAEGAALSPLPAPREPSGMGTGPWGLGAHPARPVGTRGAGGDAGEGWAGVLAGRERQQAGQRPAGRAMGTGQWPPGDTGDAGTSPGHPRQGCGPPAPRAGVAAGASQAHKPRWGPHSAGGACSIPRVPGRWRAPAAASHLVPGVSPWSWASPTSLNLPPQILCHLHLAHHPEGAAIWGATSPLPPAPHSAPGDGDRAKGDRDRAAVTWGWGWGRSPEWVPILGGAGMSPRGVFYGDEEDFSLQVVKLRSAAAAGDERLTALIRAGTAVSTDLVKH